MNVIDNQGNIGAIESQAYNGVPDVGGRAYSARVCHKNWRTVAFQRGSNREASSKYVRRTANQSIGRAPQMQGSSPAESLETALLILALFASGFIADFVDVGVLT